MTSVVQQQSVIGQGLAVGMMLLGVESIGNRMAIEFAFRHAWRRWPEASRFPQIHAGPSRDDIVLQVIGRSERRRGPIVAAWDQQGGSYVPYLVMENWTLDDAAEHLEEMEGIPRSRWFELAKLVHARLVDPRS